MQWIAKIPGDNPCEAILDLDEVDDGLRGYVLFTYLRGPSDFAFINLPSSPKTHDFSVTFRPIYPGYLTEMKPEHIAEYYPDGYDVSAQVTLTFGEEHLDVSWVTNKGVTGSTTVPNSHADKPSELEVDQSITTWKDFKRETSSITPERFVFRGQTCGWRLRTAFHRTGRNNLIKYVGEDLPRVNKAIIGKTKHLFNRQNDDENAAFIHLLQHHGFPTPLLDWSESPFIAAFFAYQTRRSASDDQSAVRIYVFDKLYWQRGLKQLSSIQLMAPHVSIVEPLGIENDRAMPQQALSTVTNVDDVETYILQRSRELNHKFLYAIDLPYEDRLQALRDLAMMGITAGAMFPGLVGTCQEMTDRIFGYDRG